MVKTETQNLQLLELYDLCDKELGKCSKTQQEMLKDFYNRMIVDVPKEYMKGNELTGDKLKELQHKNNLTDLELKACYRMTFYVKGVCLNVIDFIFLVHIMMISNLEKKTFNRYIKKTPRRFKCVVKELMEI